MRDLDGERVRAVIPTLVVEDTDLRVVLHLPRGTPVLLPVDDKGELTRDPTAVEDLVKLSWEGFEQLIVMRQGASHAVIVRWEGSRRRFVEWYVNLQTPFRRTSFGFDVTDHVLDVVMSPDLRLVEWKDQKQLADLVASGYFTNQQAEGFYAEGERVISSARRGDPPFRDGWEAWKPDPTWPTPSLPARWDY